MLPGSTSPRKSRDRGPKTDGRTIEIQRLIGRSLRAGLDMAALGERSITVDCDVLEADGGTRTAAITGGFVALYQCISFMTATQLIPRHAIKDHVAAISCGMHQDIPVLDLDYAEDSGAGTDANFVITGGGGLVEVQATAEGAPFSEAEFGQLLALARKGTSELMGLQKEALKL